MSNRENPIASRPVESPSKVDRKVMCAGYERCLDVAIRRRWENFSCRNCRAYKPLKRDSIEWLADSLACNALIFVAEFPSLFKQKSRGGVVRRLRHVRTYSGALGLA